MIVTDIYNSYKNTIIGTIVGGTAGYYAANKYLKEKKTWTVVISIIIGATLGSVIDNRIRAKIAMNKSKNLIQE